MRRLLAAMTLLVVSSTGCKQELGERCQIEDDCEEGLVCGTDGVCRERGQMGGIDAGALLDGSPWDGPGTGLDAPSDGVSADAGDAS